MMVRNMHYWLNNTLDTMPLEWTTKRENTDIDKGNFFCSKFDTDTLEDIYTENYIYFNRQNNGAYCDPNIDIRACLLFSYRYKMNLIIYAEIAEDTWYAIIRYRNGGYKIYSCGNNVALVSF